jgi:GNAT superfamily N-acetyltransferase
VLNILATDPAYMRRGAGAALVAWGLAIADKEKVPVWLESSPFGWPLYQRLGFEVVDTQDLDIGGRYNAQQKDGEDWGANLAVDKLGPLAPGHFRTAMVVRRPVADA